MAVIIRRAGTAFRTVPLIVGAERAHVGSSIRYISSESVHASFRLRQLESRVQELEKMIDACKITALLVGNAVSVTLIATSERPSSPNGYNWCLP